MATKYELQSSNDGASFLFCIDKTNLGGSYFASLRASSREPRKIPVKKLKKRSVRDKWEYPRKMERDFPISRANYLPVFVSFPNSLHTGVIEEKEGSEPVC